MDAVMDIAQRFLSFQKMLSGTLVKWLLYYPGLVVIILGGLGNMVNEFALWKPFALVLFVVLFRIICESLIVLFRISDNLALIVENQKNRQAP